MVSFCGCDGYSSRINLLYMLMGLDYWAQMVQPSSFIYTTFIKQASVEMGRGSDGSEAFGSTDTSLMGKQIIVALEHIKGVWMFKRICW